jgi:hypothetical protein
MIGIDAQYNLPDLFATVFGIHYYIAAKQEQKKSSGINYNIDAKQETPAYDRMSQSGTPVMDTIVFEGKSYNVLDKDGKVSQKSFKDFELPVASLVSINRAKRIIKTPVNAGNGTVKELYGFDDWHIDINGFCIPDSSQPQGLTTPAQLRDELYQWEKIADSIRIKGGLSINKDIHDIAIEDFRTWQLKGSPKLIPFSIRAISDEPVELLLK